MSDINVVMLMGRLGGDPEIRDTRGGEKVASFSLATAKKWRDKTTGEAREKTEWHRVVVFGRAADIAEKYLRKGLRVHITGQLQTRKWQDKNGNDRYMTEVVVSGYSGRVDLIDFADDAGRASQSSIGGQTSESTGARRDPYDDEIPF